MDTSVFFHLAPAPAVSPDWGPRSAGLDVARAVASGFLFTPRDLTCA